MTRYLISFGDGAMTFPEEDLPDVAEAAHAVVQEAKDAGVWVFGGGPHSHDEVSVVATDGTVTDGPYLESKAYIGGFSVVDVPSRERRWSGLAGSPSPAVVHRRFASSCPALRPDQGDPREATEGVSRFAARPASPVRASCRPGCWDARRETQVSANPGDGLQPRVREAHTRFEQPC